MPPARREENARRPDVPRHQGRHRPQPSRRTATVVTVYYKGALINGKVFDQTKPEEPLQFPVGGVIPGWTEA